jgi:hypothetical protein
MAFSCPGERRAGARVHVPTLSAAMNLAVWRAFARGAEER